MSLYWAFDGARRTGYRGYFYFPSLDPAAQQIQFTRDQLSRRINWAYNNIGAVSTIIDGLAYDEVDTGVHPKPASSNPNFNAKARLLWTQQCGFHKSFDAAGEQNFYSAQVMVRREIRLRGDCFGQKLRIGEAASCPQMSFLPGYQCQGEDAPDGRIDNNLGRALSWQFQPPSSQSIPSLPSTGPKTLAASDVIHFHDPFLIGQKRGISCLAPVASKLFSLDDIGRSETNGVLGRTRIAYAIEKKTDDSGGPTLLPGVTHVEEVDNGDGTKTVIQKITSQSGETIDVADLPPNRTIKVVESNKTSESGGWIRQYLLPELAYATKYPPSYLFLLAELGQGTLVRMAQQKVQRIVNTVRDFQIIMQMLEEWWPFWVWQNIKAGNFDDVRGGIPDDWYAYLVIRPRDMTVDPGREGNLYDSRVRTGLMPPSLYVGMLYGEDDEDLDDQTIRAAIRRRQRVAELAKEAKLDLTFAEVFPPAPGSAPPPQPEEEEDDEEKEDPDKDNPTDD